MLKLKTRKAWQGKCPKHPRQQYEDPGSIHASCRMCHALAGVAHQAQRLERAIADAESLLGVFQNGPQPAAGH